MTPLITNNQKISTTQTIDVIDPYTRKRIATAALGDAQTLDHAASAAQAAFKISRSLPAHQRSAILHTAADLIHKRKQQLADLIVAEAGKPITLAEAEVDRAVITFTAAAEEARRASGDLLDADAFAPGEGYAALVRRFPVGVVYGMTPFNFPLNLVAHKVAPAVASGNTIIIKPSPRTPLSALQLGEILIEAGAIPGQVNIVTCPNDLAHQLVADDRVKHVSFTGSVSIGWNVQQQSVRKGITLELGGNAAVIVHSDADLPAAAKAVAIGAFAYAGQSCISVQRVFVQADVYDAFKSELQKFTLHGIRSGDPRQRDTINGPMIDSSSLARVQSAIDAARAAGASILTGGAIEGPCFQPTIVETDNPSLAVNADEIFAPVLTVRSYCDFEDAIRLVNDSRFGLQAGVFTRDIGRAMKAFDRLNVGGVLINQVPTFRLDNLPYGGVKDSGLGREGVRSAMDSMTEPKTLIVSTV